MFKHLAMVHKYRIFCLFLQYYLMLLHHESSRGGYILAVFAILHNAVLILNTNDRFADMTEAPTHTQL